jgi:hypothetical protein
LSWSGYWNGYFGKGVLNADLETVFVFDDDPDKEPNQKMNFYCDNRDTTRGGVGLVVKARGFQWSQVLAEDCIFWLYDIQNESTNDYNNSYFAEYIDWGIGGVGSDVQNIGEYDTDLDIAFAYAPSGAVGTPGNWSPIGYAGYAFLESPGISIDGKDNDNDGMTDESREAPVRVSTSVIIRMVSVMRTGQNSLKHIIIPRKLIGHLMKIVTGHLIRMLMLMECGIRMNRLMMILGEDGVGPYDAQIEAPDEGEGDGLPTEGEPNYNSTDPDESDQIGLTGFTIFATTPTS